MVSDTRVAPLYLESLLAALAPAEVDVMTIPPGEHLKTLATVETVFDQLVAGGHTRKTTLIALGGGVIGDLTGFAAACYQRGVAFIQAPTTLLAQVDASVGGKTAVNHARGKNMIGAFHRPIAVVADLDAVDTLPVSEYRSGLAELVKHAIIRDRELLDWLDAHSIALAARQPEILAEALFRSVRIKAEIVALDERETGCRALLNFGHSFGHAMETCSGYGRLLHGEAVAIGMCLAANMSVRMGMLPRAAAMRIKKLLSALGLPTVLPPGLSPLALRETMHRDKKADDQGLRLVLLRDLGAATLCADYDEDLLWATLAEAPLAAGS